MTTMDFTYQAHGLTIWSDVELALPAGDGGVPDLVLRRGSDRAVPRAELDRLHPQYTKAPANMIVTQADFRKISLGFRTWRGPHLPPGRPGPGPRRSR